MVIFFRRRARGTRRLGLPVFLTAQISDQKKRHFYTITFQEDKHLFSLNVLLFRLLCSICYRAKRFDRSERET